MVTYSSSVIPIFLITLVLPYVERFVNKVVPSVVKFILRPVLTILIMAPISLCVLGPLGSIIGDGLVSILLTIEKVCPWALPTVIGAFMPFLVMTGMHYSLLPARRVFCVTRSRKNMRHPGYTDAVRKNKHLLRRDKIWQL